MSSPTRPAGHFFDSPVPHLECRTNHDITPHLKELKKDFEAVPQNRSGPAPEKDCAAEGSRSLLQGTFGDEVVKRHALAIHCPVQVMHFHF